MAQQPKAVQGRAPAGAAMAPAPRSKTPASVFKRILAYDHVAGY